jgi:hypothetical protein
MTRKPVHLNFTKVIHNAAKPLTGVNMQKHITHLVFNEYCAFCIKLYVQHGSPIANNNKKGL